MDFLAVIATECPAEMGRMLNTADLRDDDAPQVLDGLSGLDGNNLRCQALATGYVAGRIDARSSATAIGDFLGYAAHLAPVNPPEVVAAIAAAAERIGPQPAFARDYFRALRHNRIDLRRGLAGRISPEPRIGHPDDSLWWNYQLYLAAMGEAAAWEWLDATLAAQTDATQLWAMLVSLSDLASPQARALIARYADDPRLTRGPEGPSMPLSALVRDLLARMG